MDKPRNKTAPNKRANEKIDFNRKAVIGWHISTNSAGNFIDPDTTKNQSSTLKLFSQMKYGHTISVNLISKHLSDLAVNSNFFLSFLKNAKSEGSRIFITSPAILNLPSGSNLLLRQTARQINVHITNHGFDPLIVYEQIRLNEPNPNYCESTLDGRKKDAENLVYAPTIFKKNYVVFLDDIYITGTTLKAARTQIQNLVGAKDMFFLLAAKVDQKALDFYGEGIEGKINRFAVDETMPSLIKIAQEGCVPTQKMLRLFFEGKNSAELDKAIISLPQTTLKILYEDACQNGLQTRWGGICSCSMEKVRNYLKSDSLSDSALLNLYKSQKPDLLTEEMIRSIQKLETSLLKKGSITETEAEQRTNRSVIYHAKFAGDELVDSNTGEDLSAVAKAYSSMKFGSAKDIHFFAKKVSDMIIGNISNPNHPLHRIFSQAKANKEHIVHIESGSRNVEHGAFLIMDEAINKINVFLASNNLPTTVRFKPTRLNVVPGNYASMSKEERETLAPTTNHIMPAKEIFEHKTHVIFFDDVRITGATGNKVESSVISNGALSYSDVYLISISPEQALRMPELEAKLNHFAVNGDLNDSLKYILEQSEFRPVQRLLRLLLSEKNRKGLQSFLAKEVPLKNIIKLYVAALSNDYQEDPSCAPSLQIIKDYLKENKQIDSQGMLLSNSYGF